MKLELIKSGDHWIALHNGVEVWSNYERYHVPHDLDNFLAKFFFPDRRDPKDCEHDKTYKFYNGDILCLKCDTKLNS